MKRITNIEGVPPASGPYSSATVSSGDFIFVAGQGPWDPERRAFVRGTIAEQTQLTLECIRRIVEAAGGNLENAVSCRVFLQPLNDESFAEMNAVYAQFFPKGKPARTTVGCVLLGIDVEIDAVVQIGNRE